MTTEYSAIMKSAMNGGPVPFSRRNLYFAAACVYSLFMAVGLVMTWASPAVPKLREEGNNYTDSQEVLLSSITNLAPGPLLTIFGIDTIGRKNTLLVIWSTLVISPVVMLFTTDIYLMLVARFISGIGMGAAFSAIGITVSEISDVGVRNALNSVSMLFLSVGTLIDTSVGPFVSFVTFSAVSLGVVLVFGVAWYFLPESPYYDVKKGRPEKARKTLTHLRLGAPHPFIEEELATIQFSIDEERRNRSTLKDILTSRALYKQLAVSFYLLYLQQGSGLGPMGAFSQEIFNSVKLDFKGAYVPIGMAILTIFIIMPTPLVVKKFGTRALFFFGGFGTAIFNMMFGIFFILLNSGYDLSSVKYLPIFFNLAVSTCTYFGVGGSVWGMVSDLFAPSVKGTATGICGIFSTFMGFVATQTFGELKNQYGFGASFLAFGVVQFVMSFGLFLVPDTSKMTLQEIQDYFEGKSSSQTRQDVLEDGEKEKL